MKIFIYGVPGSGKTYYSKLLGTKLNLPVIEADRIKKEHRSGKSKKLYPCLYLGTCQAYKKFGDLTSDNTIKGLFAVRKALDNVIKNKIKKQSDLILEGAFLDPKSLKEFGKVMLLVTKDEKLHKKQFLHHREKILDLKGNEFKAARLVQEYLIQEAKEFSIEVVENTVPL
ncbi:hypothetical protein C4577_07045 [Candidatus Parcubacteria bacterium]|nr:MAG: hypothetical protein C4577_07045 [Candidatus Parcubacteria bacterium]